MKNVSFAAQFLKVKKKPIAILIFVHNTLFILFKKEICLIFIWYGYVTTPQAVGILDLILYPYLTLGPRLCHLYIN